MTLELLKGALLFKKNEFEEMHPIFEKLASGQKPDTLLITCIDSRVDLVLVTQSQPGKMFVHRNVGNLITPYDPSIPSSVAASIEFAIKTYGIKHIVVCGHSDCGAMKGVLNLATLKTQSPAVASWLSSAAPKTDKSENAPNLEELTKRNIILQLKHAKTHLTQTKAKINLHGWYYKFESGEISTYEEEQNTFIPIEDAFKIAARVEIDTIVKQHLRIWLYFSIYQSDAELSWDNVEPLIIKQFWPKVADLYDSPDDPQFRELIDEGKSLFANLNSQTSNLLTEKVCKTTGGFGYFDKKKEEDELESNYASPVLRARL